MLCYRHFPALEDFCLVICHVCNQVVTPQGILTHYGKTCLVLIIYLTALLGIISCHTETLIKPAHSEVLVKIIKQFQFAPTGLIKYSLPANLSFYTNDTVFMPSVTQRASTI